MASTDLDLQRLLVQMEASFVKYERAWQRNLGVTDTNVKKVQSRFGAMEKSINAAGANTARAFSPVGMQTSNIAAQFQDIAVMLQAGQSPFTIAMQQGTQLSAVLNQAKNPVSALGAAFMQMVNPVSLATIATIALGGAAVQYLGTLLGDGKSATEVVKEQDDVIRRVAERWGEAVPALRAYVDQLDRAAERRDFDQAISVGVAKSFEELRAVIPNLRAELAAARIDIEAMGGTAQEIDALQASFNTLVRKVEDGTATTADLDAVMAQLAGTTGAQTVPTLIGLQEVLASVSAGLAHAARQAADFTAAITAANSARIRENAREGFNTREFVTEQERLNSLTAEQLALENEIARVKAEAERADTNLSEAQALALAQDRLAAEERRSQLAANDKSGAKAAHEAERERQAVLDLISTLEFEQAQLGRNALQQEISNRLREAGAAATPKQREQIEALVTAIYNESAALEEAEEQAREFAAAGREAVQGFIQDMLAGKDATEALNNALKNVGNRLINMGLDALFGGGGKKGGTGLIGQLFGFADGGIARNGKPLKTFARGGISKTAAVFGEGPMAEAAVPLPDGRRIPVDLRMPEMPARSAESNVIEVNFAPTIDARGADIAAVARIEQVLARQSAEFEGRVKQIVKGRGHKWR